MMSEPIAAAPSRFPARMIGVVYLFYFLAAILAAVVTKGLVVSGDAAATAANLQTHENAFRTGFAIALFSNVLYVALTAFFYGLFEPVNRDLSRLAAFISLIGCVVQTCGGVFQLGALVVLGGGPSLSAFKGEELQALALLFLRLYAQTFNIGLVFFAFYDLLLGWLIYRSRFLPRTLGVLMMVAGLGWLTFLWPPLASSLARYVQPLGFLAEMVLMLWLIVMGVKARTSDPALPRTGSGGR